MLLELWPCLSINTKCIYTICILFVSIYSDVYSLLRYSETWRICQRFSPAERAALGEDVEDPRAPPKAFKGIAKGSKTAKRGANMA